MSIIKVVAVCSRSMRGISCTGAALENMNRKQRAPRGEFSAVSFSSGGLREDSVLLLCLGSSAYF